MYDNEFKAKGNKIQTKDKIDHNVCIQEISPGSDKTVRPSVHPPTPLCCVSLSEMPHVLARSLRRIYQISVFSGGWWWLGGGGVQRQQSYGEAPHPGPIPSPQFIYHF